MKIKIYIWKMEDKSQFHFKKATGWNSQKHKGVQTREGQRRDVMNIVVLQNPSGQNKEKLIKNTEASQNEVLCH